MATDIKYKLQMKKHMFHNDMDQKKLDREDKMEEIKELNKMQEDGLLTEEEFVSEKKKVLGRD
jgi:hypothetical protein